MKTALAVFMGLAVTVIAIVTLLYGKGFNMTGTESHSYDQVIQAKTDSALGP